MSKKEQDIIVRPSFSLRRRYVEYDGIRFEEIRARKKKRINLAALFTVGMILILCVCLVVSLIMEGDVTVPSDQGNIPSWGDPFDSSALTEESTDEDTDGTSDTNDKVEENTDTETEGVTVNGSIYDFDLSLVPEGETPIIPMDLSLSAYGNGYIHNSTGLKPDIRQLLGAELKFSSLEYLSVYSAPSVLIIHTHGTESYSKAGAVSYKDDGGEIARSENIEENVVAVGRELSEALRKRGVNNIHCEIMHDADGYKNAYTKAEETIRSYLERYPTIRLVIDLHRDSVIRSTGELVRPVAELEGEAAAQIMCVVGSDYGGEKNTRWEANLALALQFREYISGKNEKLCRPVYLKSSTYNQEIAPYSMLLEVGASGNSLDEALAVCDIMAEAICSVLIKK